jgi:hypothetical protein
MLSGASKPSYVPAPDTDAESQGSPCRLLIARGASRDRPVAAQLQALERAARALDRLHQGGRKPEGSAATDRESRGWRRTPR